MLGFRGSGWAEYVFGLKWSSWTGGMLIVPLCVMVCVSLGGGGGDGDLLREVELVVDSYSGNGIGLGGVLGLIGSSYYETGVYKLGLKGSGSARASMFSLGFGPKSEMVY